MNQSMHEAVELLDNLVIASQNLADIFMQCLDRNPEAAVEKPADAEIVNDLCERLGHFLLAGHHAVNAVAAYVSGQHSDRRDF